MSRGDEGGPNYRTSLLFLFEGLVIIVIKDAGGNPLFYLRDRVLDRECLPDGAVFKRLLRPNEYRRKVVELGKLLLPDAIPLVGVTEDHSRS
jgi:hypothetical protein